MKRAGLLLAMVFFFFGCGASYKYTFWDGNLERITVDNLSNDNFCESLVYDPGNSIDYLQCITREGVEIQATLDKKASKIEVSGCYYWNATAFYKEYWRDDCSRERLKTRLLKMFGEAKKHWEMAKLELNRTCK